MSALTFDTLKYANTLKAGGVPPGQAEAEAVALSGVLEVNFKELVTKQDLEIALSPICADIALMQGDIKTLKTDVSAIRGELQGIHGELQGIRVELTRQEGKFTLLQWMLGIIVAGILALIMKAFFL